MLGSWNMRNPEEQTKDIGHFGHHVYDSTSFVVELKHHRVFIHTRHVSRIPMAVVEEDEDDPAVESKLPALVDFKVCFILRDCCCC